MDHAAAQTWLDRYVAAWRSYDPAEVADLFAADVQYRYHPADAPVEGRDAVVAAWLDHPDAPGTYDAAYAPYAVDGDAVVATGWTAYRATADGPVVRTFDNCFLLRFDADGRATAVTELYVRRPDPA